MLIKMLNLWNQIILIVIQTGFFFEIGDTILVIAVVFVNAIHIYTHSLAMPLIGNAKKINNKQTRKKRWWFD